MARWIDFLLVLAAVPALHAQVPHVDVGNTATDISQAIGSFLQGYNAARAQREAELQEAHAQAAAARTTDQLVTALQQAFTGNANLVTENRELAKMLDEAQGEWINHHRTDSSFTVL